MQNTAYVLQEGSAHDLRRIPYPPELVHLQSHSEILAIHLKYNEQWARVYRLPYTRSNDGICHGIRFIIEMMKFIGQPLGGES